MSLLKDFCEDPVAVLAESFLVSISVDRLVGSWLTEEPTARGADHTHAWCLAAVSKDVMDVVFGVRNNRPVYLISFRTVSVSVRIFLSCPKMSRRSDIRTWHRMDEGEIVTASKRFPKQGTGKEKHLYLAYWL